MKYLRAWLVADGKAVPAIAKGGDIRISPGEISLIFCGGGAQLFATACGKHYEEVNSQPIIKTFDVRLSGTEGEFGVTERDKFGLEVDVAKCHEAVAFYLNIAEEPVPLSVVDKLTGERQIQLSADGKIKASADLSGKLIKLLRLPCIYPETVQTLKNSVEVLGVRAVGMEGDRLFFEEYPQCKLVPLPQEFAVSQRTVHLKPLKPSILKAL